MRYIESAHVGGVGLDPLAINAAHLFPFPIGLGGREIIIIKQLRVILYTISGDVEQRTDWRLIAKRETRAIGVQDLPYISTNLIVLTDNDLLAHGFFAHHVQADTPDQNIVDPQTIDFPEPYIKLPRAPTLVVRTGPDQLFSIGASIYYEKVVVSDNDVKKLMKRFIGRRQNVESHAARVIDETISTLPAVPDVFGNVPPQQD